MKSSEVVDSAPPRVYVGEVLESAIAEQNKSKQVLYGVSSAVREI